jgi:hypothetical protein
MSIKYGADAMPIPDGSHDPFNHFVETLLPIFSWD